jgi:hypothetical protein
MVLAALALCVSACTGPGVTLSQTDLPAYTMASGSLPGFTTVAGF